MRRQPFASVSLALALLLCSGKVQARQEQENAAASLPVFEFHSGFWVNLHHFLYLQGRIRNAGAQTATPTSQAARDALPAAPPVSLTPGEQREWNAAVQVYAADWSSRDLGNSEMVVVNNRLAEMENCAELSGKSAVECKAGFRPELVAALERAAPVYRARWWAEQDSENRAWIAAVAPLVRQMGADLAAQLAEMYQRPWPAGRLRVDVVWYGGPQGSYTSLEPVHITVGSHDARNGGLPALEVLFHEASSALAQNVNQVIARECRQREVPIPRELETALLFYTTGEIVRRALANEAAGGTGTEYVPYPDRNGLYDDAWSNYHSALERYWQPYLDGRVDFETAIARIVSSL